MAKGTKVKTKKGNLKWVFIKGEGRNQARPNQPEKMMFVASLVVPKDGAVHKDIKRQIDEEWAAYKAQHGVKGLPASNGIKDEMIQDPKGEIDPTTEEVKKVPTGNVIITFKTKTTWPDGKPHEIKVFDGTGKDITKAVHAAPWSIGEGSTGVLHGVAAGNDTGGNHKVTLYLSAVQLAKLVKYEGTAIDADVLDDAEDIDLGDAVAAIDEAESATPDL
jgi:hypothetical protein